jgi:calcineurin-like phosphoesterase family protein
MTNIWFTADMHLNHANIILYADRKRFYRGDKDVIPIIDEWISLEAKHSCKNRMNKKLIEYWNELVDKDDIVYHLGDFCFKGSSTAKYFEDKLNGTIIHIMGNHDSNNGVKGYITRAVMEFSNKVVYAVHRPPDMPIEIPEWCDFVICGHIHNNWKHRYLEGCDIPIINVGVDVWDYRPVSVHSLLKYYNKIKR